MSTHLTTSTVSRSTVEIDTPAAIRVTLDRHLRRIERRGSVAMIDAALPVADQESLKGRLAAIRKLLMPINSAADREQIGGALTRMFARYPNTGAMTNPRGTIAAYVAALTDLPLWATLAAIEDIERGAVEGLSPDFAPSAPRIYQTAEQHVAPLRGEKVRIETVLGARIDAQVERDPAEAARVGAQMRALADGTAARVALEQVEADRRQRERDAASIARTETMILDEYRHHGIEPVMCNGHPIPLATARVTGAALTKSS